MSKVKLLPHNQITFEKILELSKTHNKICVPQATGTGKTYLEAKIVEEWSDKNVMIFAPRNEILDETKNIFKEDCGIDEINTITYQTFNNMIDEEIIGMDLDVILFDEAHRLLAPEWSKKIQVLIDSHPQSLIFGLTATPIRADGRDIREEIFDNCSTHYITLEEAIVRDIVKMPIYVSALYTFDEVLEDMQYKIENSKNSKEEKAELKKRVKAAKNNLELSMGVPTIIKKYISDYNGKYLVFCRDTDHLEESILLVNRWFRESGYKDEIANYRIGSNYSDSNKQLEMFKKDNNNRLKLLFSIEKLNEGVHIPTVDGVILLRPTSSNVIYYQQIGRCIRADANKRPVILDLVNNMNGIKIPLQDGIKRCVEIRKNGGYIECSKEFEIDKYSIIDYLHETADIFGDIEKNLILDNKRWEKEEDYIIINFYPTEGTKITKRLYGRTVLSIQARAFELGVKYNKKKDWTKEEDEVLYLYYEVEGKDVCKRLKDRTPTSCETRAHRLGIVKRKTRKINFTEDEDIIIKKYYEEEGSDVYKRLKGRTKSQCRRRIYALGLSEKNRRWAEEEDRIMYDFYPFEGAETYKRLKNRSKRSVVARAGVLGIKLKRKYVYKYGNKYEVAMEIEGNKTRFGIFDDLKEAENFALNIAQKYGRTV